jgi:hypothetical protein
VSVLELSHPPAHAGCGSLVDPEQLRFQQGLDNRSAVDGPEGPAAAPRRELVNLARDEFLSEPAVASVRRKQAEASAIRRVFRFGTWPATLAGLGQRLPTRQS